MTFWNLKGKSDMRKKHSGHGFITLLVIAALIIGSFSVMGFTTMNSRTLRSITGKDAAQKIEKIWRKAGKAAEKTKKAAKKIKETTDKLIEKAGGKEEIARKVKKIISRFGKNHSKIDSTSDIELTPLDNAGYAYRFTYGGEKFRTVYSASFDTWTIYDSYKITNDHDIKIICQALIDEHPVHGKDLVSYRTADDMAYEWQQHNIVYELLPDSNRWKSSAKDVDLDPYDQGKSYKEIYEDRTGKKFDLKNFV